MKNFWGIVNKVLKHVDIIILVQDARFPEQTENIELEDKAEGKPIIHVLNKSDLTDKKAIEKYKHKYKNCVYLSAKEHTGTSILLQKILEISQGKNSVVGVFGYPNTGKSSIINALKGRKSAKTSPRAGYTKARQLIRINDKIFLMDTPGVLPYMDNDPTKLAMIGSIDLSKTKDPDLAAMQLIDLKKNLICKYYGVKESSPERVLSEIAIKYKKLIKGGKPNMNETAKMLLKDWQKGKIS
ncbi:50S ribosome-binding GTPase [Candidatus Woesearchaeota archaeon]|nr:50S ribosome-binding GTPase [Candidatus Woesearchaeota archaeon]